MSTEFYISATSESFGNWLEKIGQKPTFIHNLIGNSNFLQMTKVCSAGSFVGSFVFHLAGELLQFLHHNFEATVSFWLKWIA